MPKFMVYLAGTLHPQELISEDGKYIHTLQEAITTAENQHFDTWKATANGDEGITRDEWIYSDWQNHHTKQTPHK